MSALINLTLCSSRADEAARMVVRTDDECSVEIALETDDHEETQHVLLDMDAVDHLVAFLRRHQENYRRAHG